MTTFITTKPLPKFPLTQKSLKIFSLYDQDFPFLFLITTKPFESVFDFSPTETEHMYTIFNNVFPPFVYFHFRVVTEIRFRVSRSHFLVLLSHRVYDVDFVTLIVFNARIKKKSNGLNETVVLLSTHDSVNIR